MPDNYYKIMLKGMAGTDKVENSFYYKENFIIETAPSEALITTMLEDFRDYVLPSLAVVVATQVTFTSLVGIGYDTDGVPLDELPTEIAISVTGERSAGTDTFALAAIARFTLSGGVTLVTPANKPNRSYVAVGPISSDLVSNAGAFDPGSYADEFATLGSKLADDITLSSLGTARPIRASFWNPVDDLATPNLRAYRNVTGVTWGPDISFRKSRNNHR